MSDFRILIDGQLVKTEATAGVVNPATGKVFAEYPSGSNAEIDAAVEAAARAFPAWRSSDERGELLRRCASAMKSDMRSLAELITQEQGKPRRKALHEVSGAVRWFQQTAERPLTRDVLQADGESSVTVRLRPHGVVGAITPWNQHNVLHPEAPIGGTRKSGLGYQNGRWGLEAMGTLQVVNVRRRPS